MSENAGPVHPPPSGFQPPVISAPAGSWVYQPFTPKAPSSGMRVAAGIVAIVLFPWNLLLGVELMRVTPVVGLLLLTSALGGLTTGIIFLAQHRSRKKEVAVALMSFIALGATTTILIAIISGAFFIALGMPLEAAVLVLACLDLRRNGPRRRHPE